LFYGLIAFLVTLATKQIRDKRRLSSHRKQFGAATFGADATLSEISAKPFIQRSGISAAQTFENERMRLSAESRYAHFAGRLPRVAPKVFAQPLG
jgi:hypothetical protein